jgi:hypothetical protein
MNITKSPEMTIPALLYSECIVHSTLYLLFIYTEETNIFEPETPMNHRGAAAEGT